MATRSSTRARHDVAAARAGRLAVASIATVALVVAGVSCSDSPDHSLTSYCGEVQANLVALNTPQIATPADIDATLAMYRSIAERAPADVEPEWQVMIDSLETAASVVPGDDASVATANEAALSSQSAATRIQQYTKQVCGADIGTPPPPTNPVTVTSVIPTSTT